MTRHITATLALAALTVVVATAVAATNRARPASASATAYARQDTSGAQLDAVSVRGDGDKSGAETRATGSTRDGTGHATAFAAVEKVNVFDGLVTAEEVRVRADASDDGTSTSGAVVGLAIGGAPQTAPDGRTTYDLNGYGDMVALGSGPAGILGLRIRLTKDYKDYKAGSVVNIAYASARAHDEVKPPSQEPAAGTPAKKTDKAKRASKTKKHRSLSAKEKLEKALTARERAWAAELLGRPGYAFPVAGEHNFVDTFGAPRSDVPVHVGNDVFATFGTPVVAVADGRLYRVGTLKISGNRLWLRDKKGFRYFYAHLSDFAAAAYNGADVHAGEVIGFVGNTGDAEPTPPHLHFEVHMPDGAVVDPYPYLLKWDAGGVTSASWLRRYGKDPGVRPGALVVVKDFLAEG
ncbi:MAG TPA: M23 family metallopeptidase [Thermoleophilaceae bacterium]|nr:M23 family metallopeptidase [Thermoleophilaceae bacterium]